MATNTGFSTYADRKVHSATIDISDSADIVAAVPEKHIRVIALHIDASGAGVIGFNSASTEVGRVKPAGASSYNFGYNPDGWFHTASNEAFRIINGSALTISGTVRYVLI